jgi:hypothetical protein
VKAAAAVEVAAVEVVVAVEAVAAAEAAAEAAEQLVAGRVREVRDPKRVMRADAD